MAEKEPTFEEALEELRGIVQKLSERGEGLDASLKAYERGVKLVRFCQERLKKAELKIDEISAVPEGEDPPTSGD